MPLESIVLASCETKRLFFARRRNSKRVEQTRTRWWFMHARFGSERTRRFVADETRPFAQHLQRRGETRRGRKKETGGSCFLAKGQSVGEGRRSILIPIIASFSDCNWVDPFSRPTHPCLHPPDDGRTFPQQRRKVETREEAERERERVEIYIFCSWRTCSFWREEVNDLSTNDHRLKVICRWPFRFTILCSFPFPFPRFPSSCETLVQHFSGEFIEIYRERVNDCFHLLHSLEYVLNERI